MKLDLTKIEGYENMTPEEKLKALEGYDVPDPDYSGYVKKDMYDKTASELAEKKKQLQAKLTEDLSASLITMVALLFRASRNAFTVIVYTPIPGLIVLNCLGLLFLVILHAHGVRTLGIREH